MSRDPEHILHSVNINVHNIFEMLSFTHSHSKDTIGTPEIKKIGSLDHDYAH